MPQRLQQPPCSFQMPWRYEASILKSRSGRFSSAAFWLCSSVRAFALLTRCVTSASVTGIVYCSNQVVFAVAGDVSQNSMSWSPRHFKIHQPLHRDSADIVAPEAPRVLSFHHVLPNQKPEELPRRVEV